MNYFKNQLAKSVKQKTFLFLLIGAFSLGCCFSIYLKLMEPINLPATITAEKRKPHGLLIATKPISRVHLLNKRCINFCLKTIH